MGRFNSTKKTKEKIPFKKQLIIIVKRFLIWLLATLLLIVVGLYGMLYLVTKGPSPYIRDIFVVSAMESSVGGILAQLYLSNEEIQDIMNRNSLVESTDITDTSLIHFSNNKTVSDNSAVEESEDSTIDPDGDGIDVYDVHGKTYNGKMMVIYDPSRVKVGVCDTFSLTIPGLTLTQICEKYDCVAGVNGGKYNDEAGIGTGAMPEGIVISEGKLLMGDLNTTYGVYGLTNDNVLVVGYMTAASAISMGVRDAVSFGPALITNGVAANVYGASSGLNPRTAIGQREDGAILLLVIEGRQASSVGASYADLIDVMQEYGAINAANLDGGMSSSMYYNDDLIIHSCTLSDARKIPTAFVVEKLGGE